MSFSSCANSALVPIPPKYPTADILSAGYVEVPELNYTPAASGTYIDCFTPITLPQGVWLLTGVLRFDATAGNIETIVATCRLNPDTTNIQQGSMVWNGVEPYVVIPISCVVTSGASGAEDVLDLAISATTSGAANWELNEGISSILKLVRIA